jgi:hypothetical protein
MPDARLRFFAVRLGKVSLSRVCHPQPDRSRQAGSGPFSRRLTTDLNLDQTRGPPEEARPVASLARYPRVGPLWEG